MWVGGQLLSTKWVTLTAEPQVELSENRKPGTMLPKRKFEPAGVPDHPGGQIDQILNDRFEASAAGRFAQREQGAFIG